MVDPFLNRRKFIGATAVASAGLLLNSCKSDAGATAAPATKSSLSTINVALIGYGEEGKVLLESLLNIEGVKLVRLSRGCWDPRLEIKDWSNVWCVSSRTTAGRATIALFDQLVV